MLAVKMRELREEREREKNATRKLSEEKKGGGGGEREKKEKNNNLPHTRKEEEEASNINVACMSLTPPSLPPSPPPGSVAISRADERRQIPNILLPAPLKKKFVVVTFENV